MATKTKAKKTGKSVRNDLPFTLYEVRESEENKHADTTFLHCTNGRTFAVTGSGYCSPGELLIAEWEGDKLKALSKANVGKTVKTVVRIERCIKGASDVTSVTLGQVTDQR